MRVRVRMNRANEDNSGSGPGFNIVEDEGGLGVRILKDFVTAAAGHRLTVLTHALNVYIPLLFLFASFAPPQRTIDIVL